ncbi:MAG: peptidylprolyl isomerase [Marinifilaceae bacterium]|jgi:cyclophilin family peptidyl-prolyl cis-trans isomerase|nr:peptidylprolyl isomerase [Marinifilaceae bacterium]
MLKKNLFILLGLILSHISINKGFAQKIETTGSIILIETNMGNMKLKLYKDTPKHRRNFLQLIENKHFDGTLFYRCIKGFVIQGGSQDSRNAPAGKHIGYGDSNRSIESEFKPNHYHKKGALASPRKPDKVNVFKESDVSQFYIVHGRKYTEAELKALEDERNKPIRKAIVRKHYTKEKKAILDSLKKTDIKKAKEFAKKIKDAISFDYDTTPGTLKFTKKQKADLINIGGVPHLDNNYTVFGEVIEGLEVIDKIVQLQTDKNDRPYKDVKMKVKILKY